MASFLARVELHGGGAADYAALHVHMRQIGFRQKFRTKNFKYELPGGTYLNTKSDMDIAAALASIESAATAAGFGPDTRHNKSNHTSSIVVVEFSKFDHAGLQRSKAPKPK